MTKPLPPAPLALSEALQDREKAELETLLGNLPGDASGVLLWRRSDKDGTKWDSMGRMPSTDFSVESVRDVYGGGEYRYQIVNAGGRFISQKIEFSIDPRFKPIRGPLVDQAAVAVGGSAAGSSELAELTQLLKLQLLMQWKQGAPSAAAAVPGPDPIAQLKQLSEIIANLTRAGGGGGSSKELVDMLLKGMSLGAETAGHKSDDPLAAAILSASPLFDSIGKHLLADTEMKRQRLMATNGNGRVVGEIKAADPAAPKSWVDLVRPYLGQVAAAGRQGKPAVEVAHQVIGLLPGQWADTIADDAAQGGFVDRVLPLLPELIPLGGWAREFLAAVEQELTEPVDEAKE